MIDLSICIPTIVGREAKCDELLAFISEQIEACDAGDRVEVIVNRDNREMSIGAKRNAMYRQCIGRFSVQVDDDDWISDSYIKNIMLATGADVDCIGYLEEVNQGGNMTIAGHSIRYEQWEYISRPTDGVHHRRTPFCKTPILTTICQSVTIPDIRFGEDHAFAQLVKPMLRNEVFINEVMYYYDMPLLSRQDFKKRYGGPE